MSPSIRVALSDPSQREVVAFGAARGEDHFFRGDAVKSGHLVARLVDRLPGTLPEPVHTGGIAVLFGEIRHHCLQDFWIQRRGGRVIQVNHRHHSMAAVDRFSSCELSRLLARRTPANQLLHRAVEGLHVLVNVE